MRRGFILVAALGIMAAMFILALGLIDLGQALGGFSLQVENEQKQCQAINAGLMALQDVLQGEEDLLSTPPVVSIDAQSAQRGQLFLAMTALPGAPGFASHPGAAGATELDFTHGDDGVASYPKGLSLGQPHGALVLQGIFNGGEIDSSVDMPTQGAFDVVQDGYSNRLATSSTVTLPVRHGLVFMQSVLQSSSEYLGEYSAGWPYGLLAGTSLSFEDLGAAQDLAGDVQSGVPVSVFSAGSVTSVHADDAYINGHLWSSGADFHLNNPGGVVLPLAPPPPGLTNGLPTQFFHNVSAAVTNVEMAASQGVCGLAPLDNSGLAALMQALQCGGWASQVSGAVGPSDSPNPNQLNHDLTVSSTSPNPSPLVINVPGGLTIAGDVFIEPGSVLVVVGNFKCDTLYMSTGSTLLVEFGAFSADHVDMVTSDIGGVPLQSITATILSDGSIQVPNGTTTTPGAVGDIGNQPFQPICSCCGQIAGTLDAGPLVSLLGTITGKAAVQSGINAPVPGVLMVSMGANNFMPGMQVGAGGGPVPPKVSGLYVSLGGAIEVGETGARTVGAVWSGQNSVTVHGEYRYYPYFTHAFIETANSGTVQAQAKSYHLTAYGREDR
ncbi:MAG TPA: hypothetical protein VGO93_27760 [Candidatus Xenobia bacterium]|jgi:hypothetical protein